MGNRTRWIVGSIVAVLAGVGAAVAVAAISGPTTIGYLDGRITSAVYDPGTTRLSVQAVDPDGRTYAVPDGGGVITHWSVGVFQVTGTTGGLVGLRVMRKEPGANVFSVVGSDDQVLTEGETQQRVFSSSVRIPVSGGERLGVVSSPSVWVGSASSPGTPTVAFVDGDRTVGQTVTMPYVYGAVDMRLQAIVEPDGDGDGYGDATQDACPADRDRQAAPCAPAPTVTLTTTQTRVGPPASTEDASRACVVPPLIGLSRAAAGKRLKAFGCAVGAVKRPKGKPRGGVRLVVVSAPKPGTRRPKDAPVDLRLGVLRRR